MQTHIHTPTHTNQHLCVSLTAILRFTEDDIEKDLRVPQISIHLLRTYLILRKYPGTETKPHIKKQIY